MWILMMITLLLLGLCSYSDIKSHTIEPITLIAFGAMGLFFRGYAGTYFYGFPELMLRFLPGICFLGIALLKKEWIGIGDGLLILVTGYLLGAALLVFLRAVAFGISGLYGLAVLLLRKKGPKDRIPFAPFLFVSGLVILTGMVIFGEKGVVAG